jgi:hypothetical protein
MLMERISADPHPREGRMERMIVANLLRTLWNKHNADLLVLILVLLMVVIALKEENIAISWLVFGVVVLWLAKATYVNALG